MGTVLKIGNWIVIVYTHDHPPAHVHIIGPDGRAKVMLNCPDGPLLPTDIRNIDKQTMRRLMVTMQAEIRRLCEGWESMHGQS